ncbi:GntR family transcriptional regulator [Mycolicibacterium sp. GF69]|uniref:GntR family transcriptional regulator n=1 Tax=Mycolicibacterium sp. GF69 TaxID=2267251 RepID=UPI000DCF1AC6|nr:GntR family transcriptional regulator [Mycolicibacterium sp. GF69]RAV11295.1 GntR family transcriptional regulator [Mycolicibacterium sp. GF69]
MASATKGQALANTAKGPESTVNAPAAPPRKSARGVRREQLSDEVAARLRVAIMTGALRPGTYIRLDETAAALGVSITPVREALRTLRGEGMVQLEPHRGHVVVPLTRADVEDIFWLQATIAKELAATAAVRITEGEIDEMARLNDDLAAAVQRQETAEIAAAEFAFHRAFNRSTGRIKLAWFLLHVARYLPGQIYAGDPQWGVSAVAGHRDLIAALRRRDVDTVVALTAGEFTDGAQRLIAQLEETGLWS